MIKSKVYVAGHKGMVGSAIVRTYLSGMMLKLSRLTEMNLIYLIPMELTIFFVKTK